MLKKKGSILFHRGSNASHLAGRPSHLKGSCYDMAQTSQAKGSSLRGCGETKLKMFRRASWYCMYRLLQNYANDQLSWILLTHPAKYKQRWPQRICKIGIHGHASYSDGVAWFSSATANQTRRWSRVTLQRSTTIRLPWHHLKAFSN